MNNERTYTAFAGNRLVATGSIETMLLGAKKWIDSGESDTVLAFDDSTGAQIDFDFRGTPEDVVQRLSTHPLFAPKEEARRTGPGRPKLGVVSREVSMLPRHWEWLEQQPQGISGTLRRLVEEAKKRDPEQQLERLARDAAGKFMWAMAGNLPGFEEASRALFAGDLPHLEERMSGWPEDIRRHVLRLIQQGSAGA